MTAPTATPIPSRWAIFTAIVFASAMLVPNVVPAQEPPAEPDAGANENADSWPGEHLLHDAGRFLLATMKDKPAANDDGNDGNDAVRGAFWPQLAEHAFTTDSLYSGTAGVVPALLNMWETTGESRYEIAARRAVQHLLDAAIETPDGLTWDIAWDDAEENVHYARRAGFYTGTAGIAWVLIQAGDALHIDAAIRAGLRGFEWVAAQTKPAAMANGPAGRFIDGAELDIIGGNAGVILALLDAHAITGENKLRELALALADGLLNAAERRENGAWTWTSRLGWDWNYTGFSHGTAGIGYTFARLFSATGDGRFLDAARAAATWLDDPAVCIRDDSGLRWRKGIGDDRLAQAWEGWCHGPAGTCRLHLALFSLTGEETFLATAEAAARWIIATHDPDKGRGDSRFYAPSLCCGAAGVGVFMLDLYRLTGRQEYLTFAERIVGFLRRLADRPAANQAAWSLSGRPSPGYDVLFHGTNLMTGQGGYIAFLARLAQHRAGVMREVFQTPDFAVVGGAPGKRLLVLEYGPGAEKFRQVTRRLASYRGAEWARLADADDRDGLRNLARNHRADAVALVAAPETIDLNRNRVVLDALCRLDDDSFPDASYGFLTGAEPAHALAMLDSMARVERHGISRREVDYGITPSFDTLVIYPDRRDAAGWMSGNVYFPIRDAERCPDVRPFIARGLAAGENAGVVAFGGNGDPMRVWLFDDQRNADPSRHWPYEPGRIVRDFAHPEMPGIGASDFEDWKIAPAVVWWSTCHAGATHRAMVAGDIVSTFGRVPGRAVTFYELAPGESLGLRILSRGPSAYLAPLGPNHGWLATVERLRAIREHLALGEAIRRNHIDVALTYREQGGIPFVQQTAGHREAMPSAPGAIMREGTLNRVLFGDPTFEPFAGTGAPRPDLAIEIRPVSGDDAGDASGWQARVRVENPQSLEYWDAYIGRDPAIGERLTAGIDVPAECAERGILRVRATITDANGDAVRFTRGEWMVETRRTSGPKLWVKLNAPMAAGNGPRSLWRDGVTVTLDITPAESPDLAKPHGKLDRAE